MSKIDPLFGLEQEKAKTKAWQILLEKKRHAMCLQKPFLAGLKARNSPKL
jgi:hypothetical protein